MKPFITTLLALSAVACGSGGQAPADFHADGDQTTPVDQSQTPDRASGTVPPLSSQQPPIDSQTPPLSSQSPPLNSQAPGSRSTKPLTCGEVEAVVNGVGCGVSDNDVEYCDTWSAAGSPCAPQLQELLVCLMQHIVCNDDGRLDRKKSCPDQSSAVDACVDLYDNSQAPVCSKETQCRDCATACLRCLCDANNAVDRCTRECTNATP